MNIQKKIVRLMTFKLYLEHTEAIFKELHLLHIFKINNYLTALFMNFFLMLCYVLRCRICSVLLL